MFEGYGHRAITGLRLEGFKDVDDETVSRGYKRARKPAMAATSSIKCHIFDGYKTGLLLFSFTLLGPDFSFGAFSSFINFCGIFHLMAE